MVKNAGAGSSYTAVRARPTAPKTSRLLKLGKAAVDLVLTIPVLSPMRAWTSRTRCALPQMMQRAQQARDRLDRFAPVPISSARSGPFLERQMEHALALMRKERA